MIGSLVALADKVTKLLEHREKRAQFKYQTLVAPMHASLMAVHGDYLKMLEACVKGLRDNCGVGDIADQLEVERTVNEPLRRDLSARLTAFHKASGGELYGAYFDAVGKYLSPWRAKGDIERISEQAGIMVSTSRSLLLMFRGAKADAPPSARALMCSLVEAQLERMRTRWDSVALAHARLQATLVE
jgi:hypothetical protein